MAKLFCMCPTPAGFDLAEDLPTGKQVIATGVRHGVTHHYAFRVGIGRDIEVVGLHPDGQACGHCDAGFQVQPMWRHRLERVDEVAELWAALDMVALVGEDVRLDAAPVGNNRVGPCPFCAPSGDDLATFVVSPDRKIWQCFACGEGGSPFTFLMKQHHLSLDQAIDRARAYVPW